MKYLSILLLGLSLSACQDYAEDEDYAHIKKTNITCKVISQSEVHPSKSTPYLDVRSVCAFRKFEQKPIPEKVDQELLNLLSTAGFTDES